MSASRTRGNARIELLGSPRIHTADGALSGAKPVVFGAALYLGLHRGRRVPRSELAATLWPDADGATRSERTRWLVHRLRQSGLPIEARAPELTVPRDAVSLDVDELDAATSPVVVLEMARNAPLAGYEPAISDEFSRWLEGTRDTVRSRVLRSLAQWLAASCRAGDLARVEEIARALLSLDTLHEEAALALAEVLAVQGRHASAAEVLARFATETGYDQQPPAIRHMRTHLRELTTQADAPRARAALVGRSSVVARLLAPLQEHSRSAGMFAVAGPAGIGKSRVLDEVATIAPLRGARVARVRCDRLDALRPLSLVADIARQLLTLRGAIGASPDALATLQRLLGERVDQEGDVPYEARRSAVLAALRDLIEALAEDGPVTIIADDVQWAEAGSWTLLSRLMGTQRGVSWVLGLRADSSEAAAALTRRIATTDDVVQCDIELLWLPPLETADVATLIAMHAAPQSIPAAARDAIVARGAGIPFIVQALVEHWRAEGDLASLPPSVARLVAARLDRLSPPAVQVLEAMAVLGSDAEPAGVEAVSTLSRTSMLAATRELESAGILQRAEHAFSAHALWTEAILARAPHATLVLLHRYAAEWLETLSTKTSTPDHRRHCAIASHWLEAKDAERARHSLHTAADVLRANGFVAHAAEMLERAAEIAGVSETALRYLQHAAAIRALEEGGQAEAVLRRLNDRYNAIGAAVLGEAFTPHHDVESLLISATGRHGDEPMVRSLRCVLAEDAPSYHRLVAALRIFQRYEIFDTDRDVVMHAWQVAELIEPTTPLERYAFERCAGAYYAFVMNDPVRGLPHALRAEAALDPSRFDYEHRLYYTRDAISNIHERLGDLDSAQKVRRDMLALGQRLRSATMIRASLAQLIGTAEEAGRFEEARQLLPLFTAAEGAQTRLGRAREICRVVLALEDGDAARARSELVTPLSEADEPIGEMPQARVLAMYAHLALLEHDDAMIRRLLPRLLERLAGRIAYMEHPAYVTGLCLARLEGPAAAAAFVTEFLRDRRVERWMPRAELLALARGDLAAVPALHSRSVF